MKKCIKNKRFAFLEIGRSGDWQIWRSADLEISRSGDLADPEIGNFVEICRSAAEARKSRRGMAF